MAEDILSQSKILSRRRVLAGGAWAFPLCAAFPLSALAQERVCAVPYVDAEHKEALHYTEKSDDPKKNCMGCQYFEARGACGICRIFEKSPVNPMGFCMAWSAKME